MRGATQTNNSLSRLGVAFGVLIVAGCGGPDAPSAEIEETLGEVAQELTCGGVPGFPFNPRTGAVVCPPYNRPAVFITPHQDDETLGMAGAIYEHVQAGRDVFIELMTDGSTSGVRHLLNNGRADSFHPGSHTFALTPAQFSAARSRELRAAAARLGVKGVFLSPVVDGRLSVAQVGERIRWWQSQGFAGLSLKGTAGAEDPRASGSTAHPDHAAVWDALVASGHRDIRGYFVYHHVSRAGTPDSTRTLTPAQCAAKRAALNEYKLWSPTNGRYSIGYHSVRGLIDSSGASCREYVELP